MDSVSVLIVDDEESDRYLLKRQIKDAGITATIFEMNDGSAALDFLKKYTENKEKYPKDFPPMIIFLDINMPLVGGHEFLKEFAQIRDKLDFSATVVMMFTTSENTADKEQTEAYNFVTGYLLKGQFDENELRKVIEKVMNE